MINMNFIFEITEKLLILKKKHKRHFFAKLNFEQLLCKKIFIELIFLP